MTCKPPLLIPPQKEPIFFGPKSYAMFWNEWKINFPIFRFWNIVVQNFQNSVKKKDAQCSETDFSLILGFLVFEIWSILVLNIRSEFGI